MDTMHPPVTLRPKRFPDWCGLQLSVACFLGFLNSHFFVEKFVLQREPSFAKLSLFDVVVVGSCSVSEVGSFIGPI